MLRKECSLSLVRNIAFILILTNNFAIIPLSYHKKGLGIQKNDRKNGRRILPLGRPGRNDINMGMLLHKLYMNLAIAVIFTLFSSLSGLSMKIFPIRRGPLRILKNENLFLAQILKN